MLYLVAVFKALKAMKLVAGRGQVSTRSLALIIATYFWTSNSSLTFHPYLTLFVLSKHRGRCFSHCWKRPYWHDITDLKQKCHVVMLKMSWSMCSDQVQQINQSNQSCLSSPAMSALSGGLSPKTNDDIGQGSGHPGRAGSLTLARVWAVWNRP